MSGDYNGLKIIDLGITTHLENQNEKYTQSYCDKILPKIVEFILDCRKRD